MKLAVFLTILLIGSTLAVQTENPLSLILSQVSEHPFGSAIGSLIQMHLRNESMAPEGKINGILKILETLQQNIEEAHEHAETRYASKAAWCADTIEQLQKEYESAKNAAAKTASQQNELIREQGTKKNDLTESTSSKADLREDLSKAQTDLESEDTVFEQRHVDYSEAIAACQEAIRLLLQLGNRQPGAVFIQMNQNFGKVREQLEKHAKNTESAFIEPILDVLSQLANGTQFDYSTITNIVDLIRSLLKNLQASQQELESNHGQVRDDLQNLIANLAGQLETIQVNVDIYDTRLSEIELRLNELQPLINQYETLAEVNGRMLQATIASCKDNDRVHAEQQASRVKQLEIVNALNTYFVAQATNRD